MTCLEARDLIGPYVDDDLPEATRRGIQRHLLGCPSCAHDAEGLRIARERLRDFGDAGETVASDAFRARTLARLHADNTHLAPADPVHAGEMRHFTGPAQYQLPIRD
jgi:anti-sigma factor RsiW